MAAYLQQLNTILDRLKALNEPRAPFCLSLLHHDTYNSLTYVGTRWVATEAWRAALGSGLKEFTIRSTVLVCGGAEEAMKFCLPGDEGLATATNKVPFSEETMATMFGLVRYYLAVENEEDEVKAKDSNEQFQEACPIAAAELDKFANCKGGVHSPDEDFGEFGQYMALAGQEWKGLEQPLPNDAGGAVDQ